MTLAELISRIEQATGTSITDPNLLTREIYLDVNGSGEAPVNMVDVDGDVIVLAGA